MEFHPSKNLLFTTGLDKKLKLFQVSEKPSKLSVTHFEDLPIYQAGFINNGEEIIISGAKKHFYYHNLETDETSKVSSIFGHQDEKLLTTLTTDPRSDAFAFLGANKRDIMVLGSKTK